MVPQLTSAWISCIFINLSPPPPHSVKSLQQLNSIESFRTILLIFLIDVLHDWSLSFSLSLLSEESLTKITFYSHTNIPVSSDDQLIPLFVLSRAIVILSAFILAISLFPFQSSVGRLFSFLRSLWRSFVLPPPPTPVLVQRCITYSHVYSSCSDFLEVGMTSGSSLEGQTWRRCACTRRGEPARAHRILGESQLMDGHQLMRERERMGVGGE